MIRPLAAVLLIALPLAACASTGGHISDYATTLCVTNNTVAYGPLRIYAGGQSMRIEPGRRECRSLSGIGWIAVGGSTIGGGINGPLRVRDRIELNGGCWQWTVESAGVSFPAPCRGDR